MRFHAIAAPTGKKTQLFRTDGDVISEDPVGTAGSAASGVLQTKAARGGAVARRPAAPAATVASERLFADTAMIRTLGGGLGVLDSRIVVRLRGASDFDNLDVTSLAELNLDAAPENFRVGVGLPALGAELFYLPLEFEPGVAVDASFELRTQLEDLVNRLRDGLAAGAERSPPLLPNPLTVVLVVESDAPCRFAFGELAFEYRLVRESFPDGSPKQVLRFPRGELARRELTLAVPADAAVASATLMVAGDGNTAAGATASAAGGLTSLLAGVGVHGVRVDAERRWASPLVLTDAVLCAGLDLLVATLSAGAELRVELIADRGGEPGGDVLARSAAAPSGPKRVGPVRCTFDPPLLLAAGTYWITLESREGATVWYLRDAPGYRALEAREGRFERVASVTDRVGVARPLPAAGAAAAARSFPEIALLGQPLEMQTSDRDWVYDLQPALAVATLGGRGVVHVELSVLAASPRPVTIYPPRVEFDLHMAKT